MIAEANPELCRRGVLQFCNQDVGLRMRSFSLANISQALDLVSLWQNHNLNSRPRDATRGRRECREEADEPQKCRTGSVCKTFGT